MNGPVNNRNELLNFARSYAFVIGINHYPEINADLISAVPDAREIARILKYRQGFDEVELFLGVDPEIDREALSEDLEQVEIHFEADGATITQLLERIKNLRQDNQLQENDCIVFYFAGHGKAGEFDQGPKGYVLPSDAKPENALLQNESLIPMDKVFAALAALNCHHTLLILDCCFAGKFRYIGQKTRDVEELFFMPMYEERFERFKRERAWQVLVSAGPHQTAADWMGNRSDTGGVHSPFAQALIEALEGKAEVKPAGKNLGDGVLTSQELFLYLWDKVEKWTNEGAFHTQYPDLFPMGEHQGGQFIFFDPDNKRNFAEYTPRNPYMGLKPFEARDSDLFFGRKAVVQDLVKKIDTTPVLLITGPSGSGKTSVVKAGLFPAMSNGSETELLVFRPGTHPLKAYQVLEDQIDPSKRQLLLIDQYEELFVECTDPAERVAFERELIELLTAAKAGQMKIVLTMRSDFEWQLEASDFGTTFWDQDKLYTFLYRLPPMGLDELREALVAPAWVEAYDFASDELVDFILEEVSYAPGALPLLSFTMSELYRITPQAANRIFTFEKYKRELGGVNGALSKRAGAVYTALPNQAHRDILRHILLRMVRLNDGSYTRRQVVLRHEAADILSELDYPQDTDGTIVRTVLERLREAQLIVRGGEEQAEAFIEPAHDSLINFWPQCLQWINELGRENLLLQRNLWQSVLDRQHAGDIEEEAPPLIRSHDKRDLATTLSHTWEFNPKLETATRIVLDPKGTWINEIPAKYLEDLAPLIWKAGLSETELQRLRAIPGLEDQWAEVWQVNPANPFSGRAPISELIRAQMDNWLNRAERDFLRESWQLRKGRIEQLTKERNRAISNLFAFRAKTEQDVTIAFRMAEFAIRIDPENPQALEQLIERYYFSDHPFHVSCIGPAGEVHTVRFHPHKDLIASAADNKIWLWDTSTGREITTFPVEGVTRLYFTPDGERLISGADDGSVRFWEVETQRELTEMAIQKAHNRVMDLDLSPNGKQLVSVARGNGEQPDTYVIKIWNVADQSLAIAWDIADQSIRDKWTARLPGVFYSEEEHFVGHRSPPECVRFTGDGSRVVTCSRDNYFLVWDVATGRRVYQLTGQGGKPNLNDFYRDGRYILSVAHDNTVRKWDLSTGREVESDRLKDYDGQHFNALALHPNQREAAVADGKGFNHYDLVHRSRGLEFKARAHQGSVRSIDYAPDGLKIGTAGYRTVRIWDRGSSRWKNRTRNLLRIAKDRDAGSKTNTVCWHPAGVHFISAAEDGTLKQWTLGSDQHQLLRTYGQAVKTAFYGPAGDWIVTASGHAVELWHPETGTAKGYTHEHPVNFACFSPDGKQVLSGDEDGNIHLWNIASEVLVFSEKGHDRSVNTLAFSPVDAEIFVSGSDDGLVKIWRLGEVEQVVAIRPEISSIFHVAFSQDGSKIAVSGGRRLKVFDLKTKAELLVFEHGNLVLQSFFVPDDSKIISLSLDGRIRLLDSRTGELLLAIVTQNLNSATWGQLHPKRNQLLTGAPVDAALYWLDPHELIREAEQNLSISAFTADQIDEFGLEKHMDYAKLTDENGSLQPLLQSQDEALLHNFAEYFEYQGHQRSNPDTRTPYFEKARQLFEAASEIAQLHTPASYRERLEKVRRFIA